MSILDICFLELPCSINAINIMEQIFRKRNLKPGLKRSELLKMMSSWVNLK